MPADSHAEHPASARRNSQDPLAPAAASEHACYSDQREASDQRREAAPHAEDTTPHSERVTFRRVTFPSTGSGEGLLTSAGGTLSAVKTVAEAAGSPRANAELVRESFEAFNAGNTDGLLAAMAPDFVMHLAEFPEPLGRDVWREGFQMMRHAFPDLEARVEDVVAADDKVAVRISFRGTHRGAFQGIPATDREIRYVSHEIYRIENGLIAEEWICSDNASLFRQLTQA